MNGTLSAAKPDIITAIEAEGITLNRRGRFYWLSCPSHSDKTPSLKVDPERQTFFCFSCNEGGDIIAFIQKLHRCDFKEALRILGMKGKRRPRPDSREIKKRILLNSFRLWEKTYLRELSDRFREIQTRTRDLQTIEEAESVAALIHELPLVEYRLGILWGGTDEMKHELFKGVTK